MTEQEKIKAIQIINQLIEAELLDVWNPNTRSYDTVESVSINGPALQLNLPVEDRDED